MLCKINVILCIDGEIDQAIFEIWTSCFFLFRLGKASIDGPVHTCMRSRVACDTHQEVSPV